MTGAAFAAAPDRRRSPWLFAIGCLAVTAGVVLHLPMFLMAKSMNYRLAGMAMDAGMLAGMGLIVAGVMLAGYGLLPRDLARQRAAAAEVAITPPADTNLGPAHWRLMAVLTVALVIDIMKPASLGFTVPGMVAEYGVPRATVSLVPFFALAGTVVGSVLWGAIADIYGRRASILLSAVMFVGTSICGAMPSLAWNVAMCFMMGAAAGGMLPVTYALLAEMMPRAHRGWSLVLVGGLGAVGGYLAASGISAVLQPVFGWRVLWLANLPTGLVLVLLGRLIPESARFLIARGRVREAEETMRRFGATARTGAGGQPPVTVAATPSAGLLVALSLTALAWGLVNFGLLLWLPAELAARGISIELSSRLLAQSAAIALPTVFVCAFLYGRWSSRGTVALSTALMLVGLFFAARAETAGSEGLVLAVALLIVGANGVIATLLPYAAECFPLAVRGRATGWIAACTKAGGLVAQALSIAAVTPPARTAAAAIALPGLAALLLVLRFGRETRGAELNGAGE